MRVGSFSSMVVKLASSDSERDEEAMFMGYRSIEFICWVLL